MDEKNKIKESLLKLYSTNRKRKNIETLKSTQKCEYKKQAKELLMILVDALNAVGYRYGFVNLLPITGDNEIDKKVVIDYNKKEEITQPSSKEVLLIKDEIKLSDKNFHKMRKDLNLDLPSLSSIKVLRKNMNQTFVNSKNNYGSYTNISMIIENTVKNIMKRITIDDDEPLRIKFSGDGANITTNNQFINFTFTVINENDKAKTPGGNYSIGIFKVDSENYENLKNSLNEVIFQIENLTDIRIDNKCYNVERLFTADMKFLSIMLGINGANANQPCIWCKYDKTLKLTDFEWSILDEARGARTIEDSIKTLSNLKIKNKQGYKYIPLIKNIPFHCYVVDLLHMFLRISEKLFELFFCQLNTYDFLNGNVNGETLLDQSLTKKFLKDLKIKCNINKTHIIEDKKYKLKSFNGDEGVKILKTIKLVEDYSEIKEIKIIEYLWHNFLDIYTRIKRDELTPMITKKAAKEWIKNFRKVYSEKDITPYMHVFEHHLHEFMELYGDVNLFNLQGLEKLNNMTSDEYNHATNKSNDGCLQILNRRMRIEISKNS